MVIFIIGFMGVTQSQNLIRNGSFEDPDTCFYGSGQLNPAFSDWISYYDSPDAYHRCYSVPIPPQYGYHIPLNHHGFQQPRTGDGYIGEIMIMSGADLIFTNDPFFPTTISEHAQTRLKYPLVKSQEYCFSYWVTLADSSYWAVDQFRAIFSSKDTIYKNHFNVPIDSAAYRDSVYSVIDFSTGIVNDTSMWVQISGSFTAEGYEEFMTIGRTAIYPHTAMQARPYVFPYFPLIAAYYYIDDVALWKCDTIPPVADAGKDTLICKGDSVKIGTHDYPDYFYHWSPDQNITNGDRGNTYVKPDSTTMFYLESTDFRFEKSYDSVWVIVQECEPNSIFKPSQFVHWITISPNPATTEIQIDLSKNDLWKDITRIDIRNLIGNSITSIATRNAESKIIVPVSSILWM